MTLAQIIQSALKSGNVIIGYKESLNFIKINSPKMVIMAKNIPESMREDIEHNAKLAKTEIKIFNGSSKELGVICGKSFPISTIVIKK